MEPETNRKEMPTTAEENLQKVNDKNISLNESPRYRRRRLSRIHQWKRINPYSPTLALQEQANAHFVSVYQVSCGLWRAFKA